VSSPWPSHLDGRALRFTTEELCAEPSAGITGVEVEGHDSGSLSGRHCFGRGLEWGFWKLADPQRVNLTLQLRDNSSGPLENLMKTHQAD
jgi:hypothetical protein